jgi:CheY-like chemotaxis protein
MTLVDEVRVIVVDDMPDAADSLAQLLESDGYTVQTAYSAEAALKLFERFQPLCVLLDIHMPDIDGLELSAHLRKLYGDDLVLVAVTGWGDPDERISNSYARFDHYLRKPVDYALLQKVLPPLKTSELRA